MIPFGDLKNLLLLAKLQQREHSYWFWSQFNHRNKGEFEQASIVQEISRDVYQRIVKTRGISEAELG